LNIDFGINNERKDCKIGTLCGSTYGKGMIGGDEDEGIGSISFIHIKEIEQ
jgi:hypothetical protein